MANEVRLIDANAFYEKLEDIRMEYLEEDTMSSNFAAEVIETVQDSYLKDAPTIDSESLRPKGRWENVQETVMYVPEMKYTTTHTAETCSVCKARVGFVGPKVYLYDQICPSCGAKMRGEADD